MELMERDLCLLLGVMLDEYEILANGSKDKANASKRWLLDCC